MEVNLTERQKHILWATIHHYIATAEPVGSKALVEEYNLSLSPATIRNAFGWLEKVGLLYQPHTSAGRVPSDSGYRIYVDRLMKPTNSLGRQVEQVLADKLQHHKNSSLESLLRGAAQILATVSGYITLITLPQNQNVRLRHVQLVQVDANRIMLIAVKDTYETTSVLMDLPKKTEEVTAPETRERELQILSNFLNNQLQGRSLLELADLDWGELDREFEAYGDLLTMMVSDLIKQTSQPYSAQIMIYGVAEALKQPEFTELTQIQTLLHFLEAEQERLSPIIFAGGDRSLEDGSIPSSRVTVTIGSENPLEQMHTYALVSANYHQGNSAMGSIGVLGPTRMFYENTIPLVEATADYLSDALQGK
jgi:heat-inducible transcriptional repressor